VRDADFYTGIKWLWTVEKTPRKANPIMIHRQLSRINIAINNGNHSFKNRISQTGEKELGLKPKNVGRIGNG